MAWGQVVQLWDVATDAPLRTLEGHEGQVFRLGFGSRPRVRRTLATEHALLSRRIQPDDQPVTEQQQPGARLITYAGEAFLPFSILHQTIVFVIGYFIVAVRRTRATRWLFGMRPAR